MSDGEMSARAVLLLVSTVASMLAKLEMSASLMLHVTPEQIRKLARVARKQAVTYSVPHGGTQTALELVWADVRVDFISTQRAEQLRSVPCCESGCSKCGGNGFTWSAAS